MSQLTTFYQKYFALYFVNTFEEYLDSCRSRRYFDLSYKKNIITFILSMIKMTEKLLELNPLFEPSLAIDTYFIINVEDCQNFEENKDKQNNEQKNQEKQKQVAVQNKDGNNNRNISDENNNIQTLDKIDGNQQKQVQEQKKIEQIEQDKNENKGKGKEQINNNDDQNKLKQKEVILIDQNQKINLAKEDMIKLVGQTAKYLRIFIIISLRFVYLYFYSKEISKDINIKKINRQKQIKDSVSVIFNQLKDKQQEYQFNPNQYMIYIFKSMFEFEVNIKFLNTMRQIIQKCNINEEQKLQLYNSQKAQQISIRLALNDKFKENQNTQKSIEKNDILIEKGQQKSLNQQIQITMENNTPIKYQKNYFLFKQSQIKKSQQQTNDKSLILFNRNRQTQESNDLTLSLKDFTKKMTQRAKFQKPKFYTNNKRTISSSQNYSQNSSIKNLNEINNQNNNLNAFIPNQYALIRNRSTRQFHSRLNQFDVDQYPFQQTPKPKKKLKLQKKFTQDFKNEQIAIKPVNLFSE